MPAGMCWACRIWCRCFRGCVCGADAVTVGQRSRRNRSGRTCFGDRVLSDRVPVRCFGAGTAGDTSVIVLLCLTLTDLHAWIIPDRLQVAGVLIFFGTAVCLPETGAQILRGVLTGAGLSGGMLALSPLFDRLTGKESLGGGDIKLFFVTGLYLRSIWEVLFFLILSCVLGIGCSLVWRKGKIPFGPAIAAAFFLMLLFGEQLTGWYRGLWLL